MKKRTLGRNLMVAAGILAALVILLSSAFQQEAVRILSESNTEAEGQCEKQLVAVAPDAVTSNQAGAVETVNPFVVQEIIAEIEHEATLLAPRLEFTASFFRVLLRTVISPQAP